MGARELIANWRLDGDCGDTAGAQLAQHLGLPCASWMSTESMVCDSQAAYEKMTTGALHALAKVNIIWGVGQLESQKTLSPEQMVIDNEIAAVLLYLQKGIEVSDDTLAVELICRCGTRAEYLGDEHTLRHFREQVFHPQLGWHRSREAWTSAGSLSLEQMARERVNTIFEQQPRSLLSDKKRQQLLEIEAEWRRKLAAE